MSAAQQLHSSLLRMPIIHILRAAGFHSTRPSVLDTLVNITERYLLLLAETTLQTALDSHNDNIPTITDVRLALTECGALSSVASAAEEDWTEKFRLPVSEYDGLKHGDARRAGELHRRADEDTRDVREFIQWIMSDQNREIRRIAGVLPEVGPGGTVAGEDYLTGVCVCYAKRQKSFANPPHHSSEKEAQQDGRGVEISRNCPWQARRRPPFQDRGRPRRNPAGMATEDP